MFDHREVEGICGFYLLFNVFLLKERTNIIMNVIVIGSVIRLCLYYLSTLYFYLNNLKEHEPHIMSKLRIV